VRRKKAGLRPQEEAGWVGDWWWRNGRRVQMCQQQQQ